MISPKNKIRICLIITVVIAVLLGSYYYYTEEHLEQWGKGTLITVETRGVRHE